MPKPLRDLLGGRALAYQLDHFALAAGRIGRARCARGCARPQPREHYRRDRRGSGSAATEWTARTALSNSAAASVLTT